MELNNYSFNVHDKIKKDERINWQLYIDAIYKSDPSKKKYVSRSIIKTVRSKKSRWI